MPDKDKTKDTGPRSTDPSSRSAASDLRIDRPAGAVSSFRLLPRDTVIVLAFAAGVLGLLMLQFLNVGRISFWMMVVFFAWTVWKRSAIALACLFVLLGAVKFSRQISVPYWAEDRLDLLYSSDITFTFLVLTFAGACFRFLETQKYCLGILSKFGWGVSSAKKSRREFPSLFGGRWWLIPVAIGSAFLLLEVFPVDGAAVQKYWIKPEPARLIFLIGALFLIWFVIRSFFMLVMRWKMDQDQAGVHIRSIYAKEFWREHRAIEARRAKAISKKS